MLIDKYHEAVDNLLKTVRETQRENIVKAGELVANAVENGGKIYLGHIVHGIEMDLIYRGGGPIFYKEYKPGETELKAGDVIFVSSVSGRTKSVVDLAWDCMQKGITVIALTSMVYASKVDPVHESGKKLHEFVTLALDNCAPAAEAMLEVEGLEAHFAASSGIARGLFCVFIFAQSGWWGDFFSLVRGQAVLIICCTFFRGKMEGSAKKAGIFFGGSRAG